MPGFRPDIDTENGIVIIVPAILNSPDLDAWVLSGTLPVYLEASRSLPGGLILIRADMGKV